jgi:hypothetical protein
VTVDSEIVDIATLAGLHLVFLVGGFGFMWGKITAREMDYSREL